MKNNRKNRRLKFIREKNAIRLNRNYAVLLRISNVLLEDVYFIDDLIRNEIEKRKKYYRIKFELDGEIDFGLNGSDFIEDKTTIRIRLWRKPAKTESNSK